jgi:redox-sensitive bicupin YhaK (pirin superfamily)
MGEVRRISKLMKAAPTIEGAGVHLKRVFGYHQVPQLDPFLLLDDFHSDDPDLYLMGFPWHPHRGIETITYLIEGEVDRTPGDAERPARRQALGVPALGEPSRFAQDDGP